jgi:hypothetical protein
MPATTIPAAPATAALPPDAIALLPAVPLTGGTPVPARAALPPVLCAVAPATPPPPALPLTATTAPEPLLALSGLALAAGADDPPHPSADAQTKTPPTSTFQRIISSSDTGQVCRTRQWGQISQGPL